MTLFQFEEGNVEITFASSPTPQTQNPQWHDLSHGTEIEVDGQPTIDLTGSADRPYLTFTIHNNIAAVVRVILVRVTVAGAPVFAYMPDDAEMFHPIAAGVELREYYVIDKAGNATPLQYQAGENIDVDIKLVINESSDGPVTKKVFRMT